MSENPKERFSVRVQQRTGAWAGVSYHPSKREALETAITDTAKDYVWAIFEGRKKVVDSRGWSGDIDFECGETKAMPPAVYVADLEMVVDNLRDRFEKVKGECRVHGDKFTPEQEAKWEGVFMTLRGVLIDELVPMLSNWKEGQPQSRVGEKIIEGLNNLTPAS